LNAFARRNFTTVLAGIWMGLSVPVKKNISSAGLVDSGPVGGEAVQKLYSSFYMR
jgi:hypothetical protein